MARHVGQLLFAGGTILLLWALWLALAVIRWLRWGWENFSQGGIFRNAPRPATVPPPLPTR